MEDFSFYLVLFVGLTFPVIVIIFSRLVIAKLSAKWVVVIPAIVLSFYFWGFRLYNKDVESILLAFSAIILVATIDQLTKEFILKWIKYIISGLYTLIVFLGNIVWIWILGDYFAESTFFDSGNPRYKISCQATGNFTDIQVFCELREEKISGLVYVVRDGELMHEVTIEELISIKEHEDSFVLTYKGDNEARLDK
ncbi:MAG: hypothetical protein AAF740_05375 [Bacteroidota bacterium]